MGVDTSELNEYAPGDAMWGTWPPGYGATRRGKRENGRRILEGMGEKGGHGPQISRRKGWEWPFGFLASQGSFASEFWRPCRTKRGRGERCPDINFGSPAIWPKSEWVFCTLTKDKVDFLLRVVISSFCSPLRFSSSWVFSFFEVAEQKKEKKWKKKQQIIGR